MKKRRKHRRPFLVPFYDNKGVKRVSISSELTIGQLVAAGIVPRLVDPKTPQADDELRTRELK